MAGRLRGCTYILADADDYNTNRHKRVKSNTTTTEDRLSALPDCLILRILSFLRTEEVVRTCLLSKRWKFIWTGISQVFLSLSPVSDTEEIRIFVDFVGRMLSMCSSLKQFGVRITFRECASNVNSWIDCVVKNKVKGIALTLFSEYELPEMLFSCSSLTYLLVRHCVMTPRGAIEWRSLKSLSIEGVELSDCVMEKILSGCPVLEFLSIVSFWGLSSLNICSPNLTTLEIEEHIVYEEVVEISAPYVRTLLIYKNVEGMRFRFINLSSVARARFEFYGDFKDSDSFTSPESMLYLNQLFQSLQSVKELELGDHCIEVLSILEMKGWNIPPSTRLFLKLRAFKHEGSIPGILGILKSSPYLETLVIKGTDILHFDDDSDEKLFGVSGGNVSKFRSMVHTSSNLHYQEDDVITRDPALAYLANGNLDLILNHLKTIKISFTDEAMLTLVRLLLKSAKVLQKMVIKDTYKFPSPLNEYHHGEIASRLLTFPRASPEAVVMF